MSARQTANRMAAQPILTQFPHESTSMVRQTSNIPAAALSVRDTSIPRISRTAHPAADRRNALFFEKSMTPAAMPNIISRYVPKKSAFPMVEKKVIFSFRLIFW